MSEYLVRIEGLYKKEDEEDPRVMGSTKYTTSRLDAIIQAIEYYKQYSEDPKIYRITLVSIEAR